MTKLTRKKWKHREADMYVLVETGAWPGAGESESSHSSLPASSASPVQQTKPARPASIVRPPRSNRRSIIVGSPSTSSVSTSESSAEVSVRRDAKDLPPVDTSSLEQSPAPRSTSKESPLSATTPTQRDQQSYSSLPATPSATYSVPPNTSSGLSGSRRTSASSLREQFMRSITPPTSRRESASSIASGGRRDSGSLPATTLRRQSDTSFKSHSSSRSSSLSGPERRASDLPAALNYSPLMAHHPPQLLPRSPSVSNSASHIDPSRRSSSSSSGAISNRMQEAMLKSDHLRRSSSQFSLSAVSKSSEHDGHSTDEEEWAGLRDDDEDEDVDLRHRDTFLKTAFDLTGGENQEKEVLSSPSLAPKEGERERSGSLGGLSQKGNAWWKSSSGSISSLRDLIDSAPSFSVDGPLSIDRLAVSPSENMSAHATPIAASAPLAFQPPASPLSVTTFSPLQSSTGPSLRTPTQSHFTSIPHPPIPSPPIVTSPSSKTLGTVGLALDWNPEAPRSSQMQSSEPSLSSYQTSRPSSRASSAQSASLPSPTLPRLIPKRSTDSLSGGVRSASRSSSRGALDREYAASATGTAQEGLSTSPSGHLSPPLQPSAQMAPSGEVSYFSRQQETSSAVSPSLLAPQSSPQPSHLRAPPSPTPSFSSISSVSSSQSGHSGPHRRSTVSSNRSKDAAPPLRQKSVARPKSLVAIRAVSTAQERAAAKIDEREGKEAVYRPREKTPLSASDFTDMYSSFDAVSPTSSNPTSPSLHRPTSTSTISEASLPLLTSPALPPIPMSVPTSPFPGQENGLESKPSSHIRKSANAHSRSFLSTPTNTSSRYSSTPSDASGSTGLEFHDVPMSPSSSSSEKDKATFPSSAAKGDAKARAAAFVADLKRAKLAAAAAEAEALETLRRGEREEEGKGLGMTGMGTMVGGSSPALPQVPNSPDEEELRQERVEPSSGPSSVQPSPTSFGGFGFPPPSSGRSVDPSPQRDCPASPPPPPPTTTYIDPEQFARGKGLPTCLAYKDVKQLKSAGERAKQYAIRINLLAKEDSGCMAWIAVKRGGAKLSPSVPQRDSPELTPGKTRHVRDEGSFPLRANADVYRAQEIPQASFSPTRDMVPTTQFPGVLHLGRGSKPPPSGAVSALGVKGAGLFSSLGRKGSRRITTNPLPPSGANSNSNSNGSRGLSPLAGPNQSLPSSSSLGRIGGGIVGPRAPRASFDSVGTSSTHDTLPPPISISPPPQAPGRPSFSSTLSGRLTEPTSPLVDEEQLQRMVDILPDAERDVLRGYLREAGGNESLALSMYLEERRS